MEIGYKEVAGLITAGGLGIVGLIKAGVFHLRIGKNGNSKKAAPSNGTIILNTKHDKSHAEIDKTLKALSDTQLIQGALIEQHGRDLGNGKDKFDKIISGMGSLNAKVEVLLDRTKK